MFELAMQTMENFARHHYEISSVHFLDMNQDIISITGRRMSTLLLVRVLMGM